MKAAFRSESYEPSRSKYVLIATIAISCLALIDENVVNVALVTIGHGLGGSAAAVQWTITGYRLPLSILLLVGGALGDRYGRKRMLLAGTLVFTTASLLCATVHGIALFLTARALEGVGAAVLIPNSMAVLGDTFTGAARGRAFGIWAASGAIAFAAGPPIGGWLVSMAGWRSVFLMNLPIALGGIYLIVRNAEEKANIQGRQLDWLGLLLSTCGAGVLVWTLTDLVFRNTVLPIFSGFLLTCLLFAAFYTCERRLGIQAMVPVQLFGSRQFTLLTYLSFFLYGSLSALIILVPFTLIAGAHLRADQAGLAFLPYALVLGSLSSWVGGQVARTGARRMLMVGSLLCCLGYLVLSRYDPSQGYWALMLPGILLVAAGMTCVATPLTTEVTNSVDQAFLGVASAVNHAAIQWAGLFAAALVGSVLSTTSNQLSQHFRTAALVSGVLSFIAALCAAGLKSGTTASRMEERSSPA